jgi:hypothetical protein
MSDRSRDVRVSDSKLPSPHTRRIIPRARSASDLPERNPRPTERGQRGGRGTHTTGQTRETASRRQPHLCAALGSAQVLPIAQRSAALLSRTPSEIQPGGTVHGSSTRRQLHAECDSATGHAHSHTRKGPHRPLAHLNAPTPNKSRGGENSELCRGDRAG